MEQNENAFVAAREKKKRQKRIRNRIILGLAAAAIVAAVVILMNALRTDEKSASILSYRITTVSSGEVAAKISGSGTLTAVQEATFTAPADARVTEVLKRPGEAVAAGEVVLRLSSGTVEAELDDLYDSLATVQSQLAGTTRERSNLAVTAPKKGVVKDIRAVPGDAAEDLRYLCLISTDDRMKLVVEAPDGLKKYEEVVVDVGGETVMGTVSALEQGEATILIEDHGYSVGAGASASTLAGTALGSGTLTVNDHVLVSASAGCIEQVLVSENDAVKKGETLFTLREGAPSATYQTRKATERQLLDEIEALESSLNIAADWDCILASLSVGAGDEVASGETLCVLSGTAGYELQLAIDELDLPSVAIGQQAEVTLDAVEGSYAGSVTNLSYAGSGSYVTTYTATITTGAIPGAYPGMSAAAEITTATSGNSLIVPVSAVEYEGNSAYVTLAPSNAQAGGRIAADDIDPDSLTRVAVTTGMSDGSYIAIAADELSAGDLILQRQLETTAVYTPSDSAEQFGGFMGGMTMPAGGGMPAEGFGGGQQPDGSGGGFGRGQRPGN